MNDLHAENQEFMKVDIMFNMQGTLDANHLLGQCLGSFKFAADPGADPGSALEKIDPNPDPDPGHKHFLQIY